MSQKDKHRCIVSDHKLRKLLKDSLWIVPKQTLQAYKTINNVSTPVKDQTIWAVDRYDQGYVFGTAYTLIDDVPTAKNTLVGSITPLGDVLFAFNNGDVVTSGQGKFLCYDKPYVFVMQTNALNSLTMGVVGISHWSYMVQIDRDDPQWGLIQNMIDLFTS